MSTLTTRILAGFAVASGIIIGLIGANLAYDAMQDRTVAGLAITLTFVVAPATLMVIAGAVVLIDTEPEPTNGCTDRWDCWCDECTEYKTGKTPAEWNRTTFHPE